MGLRDLFVLLGIWSLSACAAGGVLGRPVAKTPEAAYQNAVEDLADGLYPEALAGFAAVKAKYPYSKYAALADLRSADTHFKRGKFLEAIDAYRQFIKLHPTHAEVPYAMWQIGEAYFEQGPEDWWFLPPAAEKDQSNVRLAISALQDLLDRYPKSEHAEKARERLRESRRRLAEHELYVAKFYWKRDKYRAAAHRAEGLVKDYGGLGLDAEALWLAARARARAGDPELAREAVEKLMAQFPQSGEAAAAKDLLRSLSPTGSTPGQG